MKALIFFLLPAAAWCAEPLRVSVYATAGDVVRHLSADDARARADAAMKRLGVSRVFLEGRRGDEFVASEKLARLRDHYRSLGIDSMGAIATVPGKTFGVRQNEGYGWLNYEAPETRAGIAKFFGEAAAVFDEIMIDDFYCTGDTSEISQHARGQRSWSEYRREMLVSLIEPMMWEPARRVNPRVKLIMKFPQWYDRFDVYGYEPAQMGARFPRLWAGTEVRNPDTPRMGHVSPTEGYINWLWIQAATGRKLEGAWFDHIESTAQNFVDQAFQSVIAGARELTLFRLGDLMDGHPGDDLLARKMPELQRLAGEVQGKARRGVAFYKPVNSPAGDNRFLMDYLALMGIPVAPVAEYPQDAPVVFLGLQAAYDGGLTGKVTEHLRRGATVAFTAALARAVPELARLAGVETETGVRAAKVHALKARGNEMKLAAGLEVDGGIRAAGAQVEIAGDGIPVVAKRTSAKGRLILFNARTFDDADYAAAKELLLPPLKLGWSELTREAADALRAPLLAGLGLRISAPAKVGFYLIGDDVLIYNFREEALDAGVNGKAVSVGGNGWRWARVSRP